MVKETKVQHHRIMRKRKVNKKIDKIWLVVSLCYLIFMIACLGAFLMLIGGFIYLTIKSRGCVGY